MPIWGPIEVIPIAKLRALQRSEVLIVNNVRGYQFTSFHDILDTPFTEFTGILSPQRIKNLKNAILEQIGETLGRRRAGHLTRSDKHAHLFPLIQRVYDCEGEELERALEELLNAPTLYLKARSFTLQRSGQPDLEIPGQTEPLLSR